MTPTTILLFVVVIVVLILIHELGHFLVAKWLGVRVDEFGLGFPPKLWGKRVGETEYTINALPFGGFVRIYGENAEDVRAGEDEDRALARKPRWAQALVLIAGVAFNVVGAWIAFTGAFMFGIEVPDGYVRFGEITERRVLITEVLPDSPAALAGLEAGDAVQSVRTSAVEFREPSADALSAFIAVHEGVPVELVYERGGKTGSVSAVPVDLDNEHDRAIIGIAMTETGLLVLPPHTALLAGAQLTYDATILIAVALAGLVADLVSGAPDLAGIAGPVGIAGLVADASATGVGALLSFVGFISVNLALLNLIPFPALDGGRLLFVGVEALTRRPIKPVVANAANLVGFALLIIFMLIVTYNDIARLIM